MFAIVVMVIEFFIMRYRSTRDLLALCDSNATKWMKFCWINLPLLSTAHKVHTGILSQLLYINGPFSLNITENERLQCALKRNC